jgi:hypothetical protein
MIERSTLVYHLSVLKYMERNYKIGIIGSTGLEVLQKNAYISNIYIVKQTLLEQNKYLCLPK